MKVILISVVYKNRKPVLKFYEPKSKKLILYEDNTGYRCHFYSDKPEDSVVGNDSERVSIYDVIKQEEVEINKITVDNPMIKYEMKEQGLGWETDIKFYQDYIYDNHYIVGTWYEINGQNIKRVEGLDNNFNLDNIDLDSVVDSDKFKHQLIKWSNLLSQEIPDIKRLAFDIEVESTGDLPDPNTSLNRVTAVSFHSNDVKKVFTLKRPEVDLGAEDKDKDYELVWYDDEKTMLEDTFKLIDSYPLVLTYNGDMFDMPYLYNRAEVLGMSYNPFKMMARKATLNNGVHVDLYGVFKNRSLQLYAFNGKYTEFGLDNVALAMLGEGKTEYDGDLTTIPLHLLSKYCYNDSRITYELTTFNSNLVMNLLLILCRIGNMPIDDISRLSISNWIKSMFYSYHRNNDELIPKTSDFPKIETSSTARVKDKKYEGATVVEPKAGIHFDVTVLDFASLYPSIIKTRNVSYDTICCPHTECKTNIIPNTKHWSCTKRIGTASLLIGSLKELRVNHFKPLAKNGKTQEIRDINDSITQALKVYLNASYGVIGADTFALYFLPTAESVTAVGRDIISQTIKTAESKELPVLYGDTDSIFVHKPTTEQIDYLIKFCADHYAIDLEVDKQYKYLVLSNRKKNYFGVKKDNTLDIKGLSGKKSNTPPYLKDLFYDILETLKIIEIPEDFDSAKKEISGKIKTCYDGFEVIPLPKLALKVMINKDPSEYKVKPQVVKAGEQLGAVKKGQFVTFVKTLGKINVKPLELARRQDIDKPKYMETFATVLEQIIDPMDISLDLLMGRGKQTTLFQW